MPVFASTTGQGLPQVFSASSQTTCKSPHVFPPSVLRRRSRSTSPASPRPAFRPSQNASTVPFAVTTTDGIRYVWYPPRPETKTGSCTGSAAPAVPKRISPIRSEPTRRTVRPTAAIG